MKTCRTLHSNQRQHLQQMVLSYIAERPYAVIKRAAVLRPDFFPQPNINPFYGFIAPTPFKKIVRKTKHEDILKHLFCKVMINAINLLLLK